MSPEDVQTVVALLVDRVETHAQSVTRVVPTRPARPFFDAARTDSVGVWRAPGRTRTADASLRTAALYPLSYGGATSIVPCREPDRRGSDRPLA